MSTTYQLIKYKISIIQLYSDETLKQLLKTAVCMDSSVATQSLPCALVIGSIEELLFFVAGKQTCVALSQASGATKKTCDEDQTRKLLILIDQLSCILLYQGLPYLFFRHLLFWHQMGMNFTMKTMFYKFRKLILLSAVKCLIKL